MDRDLLVQILQMCLALSRRGLKLVSKLLAKFGTVKKEIPRILAASFTGIPSTDSWFSVKPNGLSLVGGNSEMDDH